MSLTVFHFLLLALLPVSLISTLQSIFKNSDIPVIVAADVCSSTVSQPVVYDPS